MMITNQGRWVMKRFSNLNGMCVFACFDEAIGSNWEWWAIYLPHLTDNGAARNDSELSS